MRSPWHAIACRARRVQTDRSLHRDALHRNALHRAVPLCVTLRDTSQLSGALVVCRLAPEGSEG